MLTESEVSRVTLEMGEVFHENSKNFSSNKGNIMYLKTISVSLWIQFEENNEIYQNESQIILIIAANKCVIYLNRSEIICHSFFEL